MLLKNQQTALQTIRQFNDTRMHSLLFSGSAWCGKTTLAKLCSREFKIDDFLVIDPKVSNIREMTDSCNNCINKIMICIENLDMGSKDASYALLKFLEELKDNIYIIITCRNIKEIPDTILSRCIRIKLSDMSENDLIQYATEKDSTKFKTIKGDKILWKCVKSIHDIDLLYDLSSIQLEYFHSIVASVYSSSSISSIFWKIKKFPDGNAVPVEIAVRYLLYSSDNKSQVLACCRCLDALSYNKVGVNAILEKLLFDLKMNRK